MPSNLKQIIITFVVVVLILLLLFFGIRFITSTLRNIFSGTNTRQPQNLVTIDEGNDELDVVPEPEEQYEGTLQFTATVDRVIGVRAFVAKSTDVFGDEILVISQDGIAPIGAKSPDEFLIKPNDRLLISGRLEKFNIENLRDTPLRNITTVNINSWNGRPVIIANDIDRVQ